MVSGRSKCHLLISCHFIFICEIVFSIFNDLFCRAQALEALGGREGQVGKTYSLILKIKHEGILTLLALLTA